MKQFRRRGSAQQQQQQQQQQPTADPSSSAPQQQQPPPSPPPKPRKQGSQSSDQAQIKTTAALQHAGARPAARTSSPAPAAVDSSSDPYAFELDEDTELRRRQQQQQPSSTPDLLAVAASVQRDQQHQQAAAAKVAASKRVPTAPKPAAAPAAAGAAAGAAAPAQAGAKKQGPRQQQQPQQRRRASATPAADTSSSAAAASEAAGKPGGSASQPVASRPAADAAAAVRADDTPAAPRRSSGKALAADRAPSGGTKHPDAPTVPATAATQQQPSVRRNSKAAASGGSSKRQQSVTGSKRPHPAAEGQGAAAAASLPPEETQHTPPSSQQQPQPAPPAAGSQPAPVAPTAAAAAAGQAAVGVALPTPHRRSRLSNSSLLAAAAAAAAAGEARPAQTVMEAQERGEQVQLQDDARYAMDGLGPSCSLDTQRDSAATLTDMLSTRKGRTALRAEGLAQQYLTCLAKLKAGKDPVMALAGTLSLLHLAAEDANPCYIKSVAAAVLLDQLLQHDFTFDEVAEAGGAAGAKLCRLVRVRPLANVLATTGVTSTRTLLYIALEQATSSQQASKAAAVERLKHNMRQHGALARLAGLAANTLAAPDGPLAATRELQLLLGVLENATFTCPENGAALVELWLVPGSAPTAKPAAQPQDAGARAFPAVLVSIAQQLQPGVVAAGGSSEGASAALHVALSVLMNLSHQNPAGGVAISQAGGMAVAADTFKLVLQPAAGCHEALCQAVLLHLELLSVALGVLINLVSGMPENSRQLVAATAEGAAPEGGSIGAASQQGASAAAWGTSSSSGGGTRRRGGSSRAASQQQQQSQQDGSAGVGGLLELLCTVMSAVGRLQQAQDAADAATAAGSPRGRPAGGRGAGAAAASSSPGTAATFGGSGLDGDNTAGEASIVEVYCGMLLGFLVRDCDPALARSVAARLGNGSLAPIISSIQRCLAFYVSTGAITDHTRTMLTELLQRLGAAETALQQHQAGTDATALQAAAVATGSQQGAPAAGADAMEVG